MAGEGGKDQITSSRIALAKAILSRMPFEQDIPMKLDTTIDDPAYLLGRLFALLERAQTTARPEISITIRDKFMSGAATTPGTVFPDLLRSAQTNITKIGRDKKGLSVWFDREIASIFEALGGAIPRSLTAPQQARFYAGYYQQMFSRKADAQEETQEKDLVE